MLHKKCIFGDFPAIKCFRTSQLGRSSLLVKSSRVSQRCKNKEPHFQPFHINGCKSGCLKQVTMLWCWDVYYVERPSSNWEIKQKTESFRVTVKPCIIPTSLALVVILLEKYDVDILFRYKENVKHIDETVLVGLAGSYCKEEFLYRKSGNFRCKNIFGFLQKSEN